jgi:3,4-dihydroxy-2-butanone 4-phosphate synthase
LTYVTPVLVKREIEECNGDGMARREDMVSFAKQHNLPCCSIGQMQRYIQLHGLGVIDARALGRRA